MTDRRNLKFGKRKSLADITYKDPETGRRFPKNIDRFKTNVESVIKQHRRTQSYINTEAAKSLRKNRSPPEKMRDYSYKYPGEPEFRTPFPMTLKTPSPSQRKIKKTSKRKPRKTLIQKLSRFFK